MFQLRTFLLQRPGFWFFQISGWMLFSGAMKLYFPNLVVTNLETLWMFLNFYFLGFLLTSCLRFIYLRVFKHDKSILLIVAASLISSALLMLLISFLDGLSAYPFMDAAGKEKFVMTWKHFDLAGFYHDNIFWYLVFILWNIMYFGLKAWLDLRETRERSDKAVLLAQQSQLRMLRYQLNPHFLFNSLNSIQALVYEDPERADRMIFRLSEFLRYTLRNQDRLMIPLSEEIKIVEEYLYIEQARFPDRLKYKIEISEEASRREVIAFMLQPFVENAIKHGMRSSPDFLEIEVTAVYRNGRLIISIKNNGKWIESEEEGVGIRNVFDRLQNAFPDRYKLEIIKGADGVCVEIIIT